MERDPLAWAVHRHVIDACLDECQPPAPTVAPYATGGLSGGWAVPRAVRGGAGDGCRVPAEAPLMAEHIGPAMRRHDLGRGDSAPPRTTVPSSDTW
jgi:hypothetical protein